MVCPSSDEDCDASGQGWVISLRSRIAHTGNKAKTTCGEILGRDPNYTELGIFSALWSEHCSYKHSRPILKQFPTTGPQVVQGPGENAGVLRIGDGWAVAFKIESHNHPTAVEPYQGAATGVGATLE